MTEKEENRMEKDMTAGTPGKIIFNFTMPIFIGNIFQQFYNMADTVIVGKFVGNAALAAVGACGTLVFLIIGFLQGVTAGFTVVTAQHFGAGNMKAMKKSVASGAVLTGIVTVILTLLSMISMAKVLHLMNTPSDMYGEAYGYIMVICGGIVAQALYNYLASVLRALGDSKRPLYFLVIAALLNIVLDLVFIIVFRMGAAGAAYATVIAQGISGILCLLYIAKKVPALYLHREDWEIDKNLAGWQLKIGLPMAFQYSITAIGSVILQTAVNNMGSTIVAAVTAGSRVSMFVCCPFDAMGSTMATYGGQNKGAAKYDRIDEGLKACIKLGVIYSLAILVLMIFFGKYLALLFVSSKETELINKISMFMIGNALFYIPLALVNIVRFMIQGIGYPGFAILAGVCEMIARSIAGFVLVPIFGYTFVVLASPLAWVCADMFLIPAYRHVMKKSRVMA